MNIKSKIQDYSSYMQHFTTLPYYSAIQTLVVFVLEFQFSDIYDTPSTIYTQRSHSYTQTTTKFTINPNQAKN